MTERAPGRVARGLGTIGRVLARVLAVFLAVLKPPEQMSAQTTLPPDAPRPRPDEYRP